MIVVYLIALIVYALFLPFYYVGEMIKLILKRVAL